MFVFSTAGHVDHGKSSLLRALTGMEPDRLAEEKQRNLTLDLGYVWMTLDEGGIQVAFIDVPGHTKYLGNTLVGLASAPAVLLVVSAQEGWRPQTFEHLAALNALNVNQGILAVTFADKADPSDAIRQSRTHLCGTSLSGIEVIAVSAMSGAGLPQLRSALARVAKTAPVPDPMGDIRFWIDRSFTARGSGTVVTGTLADGAVSTNDALMLNNERIHIRGLQSMGHHRDRVTAPARLAINVRSITADRIGRGTVLTTPRSWHYSNLADIAIHFPYEPDAKAPSIHDVPNQVILNIGTLSTEAHFRPLGDMFGRLTLSQGIPIRQGDKAILRHHGKGPTILGVTFMDVMPVPLTRRGAALRRAVELQGFQGLPTAHDHVRAHGRMRLSTLKQIGASTNTLDGLQSVGDWLIDPDLWDEWASQLGRLLEEHMKEHPLELGMNLETARSKMDIAEATTMAALINHAGFTLTRGLIRNPQHIHDLGKAEHGVRKLETRFAENPFAAPEQSELTDLGLGEIELSTAAALGRITLLSDAIVLSANAVSLALAKLKVLPEPFTVSDARSVLGMTRRSAIPLLEELDRKGLTIRKDNSHRIFA